MEKEDLVAKARVVVEALESNDAEAVTALVGERLADWDPGPWMRDSWLPQMQAYAGANRRIDRGWQVQDKMARFRVVGDDGEAFATVLFEADGVFGLNLARQLPDGTFGIVINCTDEEQDTVRAFWGRLVEAPLGFDEGTGVAPRWPDPAYPQQMHLDLLVEDLDAAEADVLAHGATKLRDSGTFRVYSDPIGHPFCLYYDTTGRAAQEPVHLGVLWRVVIDCPDPAVLANFWSGLLDLPERSKDTADRIVIARSDGTLPAIALQRVADYHPPRWPDPQYPAQVHFDVLYDDRASREVLALQLGATRLPPHGGSCPVYADPAGHPFCLCMTGE